MEGILRDRRILPTGQRLAVARVTLAEPRHMTAEQVHVAVQDSGDTASLATVYNTLKLFTERGLLREVIVEPGRVFYDSETRPHHHFYDVDSGKITDIPASQLALLALPEPPAGKAIADVQVIVRIGDAD
ncbi:MAG: Fur family transcriptional regulator [Gammaproteobacteria bacterium]|nr:Fur family transcriptional regulator [Gammaproteobacteria bacterium]